MSNLPNGPIRNQILANLPDSDYQRLRPHLETVDLNHGNVLYDMGDAIEFLYFPYRAMVSLVTQMEDGKIVEVGVVGTDGMTGISALMGNATSFDRALVQIPDSGVRV